MINIETEDKRGNKAQITVTEFKSIKDAVKVIHELKSEIDNLKKEIKKIKNGSKS